MESSISCRMVDLHSFLTVPTTLLRHRVTKYPHRIHCRRGSSLIIEKIEVRFFQCLPNATDAKSLTPCRSIYGTQYTGVAILVKRLSQDVPGKPLSLALHSPFHRSICNIPTALRRLPRSNFQLLSVYQDHVPSGTQLIGWVV